MRYILVILLCVFGAGCRTYRPPSGYEHYVARPETAGVTTNDIRARLAQVASLTNSVSNIEIAKAAGYLDQLEILRQMDVKLFEIMALQVLILGTGVIIIITNKGKAG